MIGSAPIDEAGKAAISRFLLNMHLARGWRGWYEFSAETRAVVSVAMQFEVQRLDGDWFYSTWMLGVR